MPKLLQYYSSTTLYYKVLLQYCSVLQSTTPVLLCTTKYYSSTTPYYKVLLQYYSVLQSTTRVLLRVTKYYSSTTLYYKVLLQYYKVLHSSTIVQDIIIEDNQVFFQIEDAKVHVWTGNIQIEEIGIARSSKRQDSTCVFWTCSNRIY